MVRDALGLLDAANEAVREGRDATYPVCAYNSQVASISNRHGGEWWIFRAKAFEQGFEDDGYMDSKAGIYNPLRRGLIRRVEPPPLRA